jgi:hypothetical protein
MKGCRSALGLVAGMSTIASNTLMLMDHPIVESNIQHASIATAQQTTRKRTYTTPKNQLCLKLRI